MFKNTLPRFVLPLLAGIGMSFGAMKDAKAQNATAERDTTRHDFETAMFYIQGAYPVTRANETSQRQVFAHGQAIDSRKNQISFELGDGQTILSRDTIQNTFDQLKSVETNSVNMLLDFSAAPRIDTVKATGQTYVSGLALRNSTTSRNIYREGLTSHDVLSAAGKSLKENLDHTYENTMDIVLTAPGGIYAFPDAKNLPAGTRVVSFSNGKNPVVNPSIDLMTLMTPSVKKDHHISPDGTKRALSSDKFATAAAYASDVRNPLLVTFVSDYTGESDTVRIGDQIIYGDTAKTTPTLYVMDADSAALTMIKNKMVPSSSEFFMDNGSPFQQNVTAMLDLGWYAKRVRRGQMKYGELPPDIIRMFRATAVEFASGHAGGHARKPYRYALEMTDGTSLAEKGSKAFRHYCLMPDTTPKPKLTP